MLEDVQLGFDEKNHMVFSACRECACFRAFSLDGNKGFCCSEGKDEEHFIPFEYPMLGKEDRLKSINLYQQNDLPEECRFHTQCSMLNFMEDESVAENFASENSTVVETTAGEVDWGEPVFGEVRERLGNWCENHPKAPVFLLRKSGELSGCVVVSVEQNEDYSWILPPPTDRHYLQKGSKVIGIRLLWAKENDVNDLRSLLGMAYLVAEREQGEDFYVISYENARGLLMGNGFRTVGYMLGGDGSDEERGACVMVKKVHDLEC